MKALIAGACLLLAACGQEVRLRVEDGVCYRSTRSWVIWQYDHTIRPAYDQGDCE